ncbi:unnamed protein product [Parnassius mnemosyne]|uniref:Uncharacterized protein n=1 Tax=Parnassius mnemosyne TaxID=213953 RepID=A0AAV1KFI5_9NEOP
MEDYTPSLLDLLLTSHSAVRMRGQRKISGFCRCPSRLFGPLFDPGCGATHAPLAVVLCRLPPCLALSADWDGMRSFFVSYLWERVCFSPDDPRPVADSVTDVVLQGMELLIPSSVVPIGGRSQPWFGRSCKTALRSKQECYQAWAAASETRDFNTSMIKKKYNFASRSFKRVIAKAKSEHVGRIGEKLVRLPSGSRAFWSLAKAAQGNFCKPSLPSLHGEDDSLAHAAKEKADLLDSLFVSNSTREHTNK